MATGIYYISIDHVTDNNIKKWQQYISEERRLRASEYLFWDDVKRCVMGEMLVLYALYDFFEMPPNKIEFELLEYGKPVIKGANECQFSLSHSGKWVVCAVSSSLVGIDIEKKDERHTQIAKNYYTEYENNRIQMISDYEGRIEEFYKIWTLKESYMKITGLGLYKGTDTFEFHSEGGKEILYENDGMSNGKYCFLSESMDEQYIMSLGYESLETIVERKELNENDVEKLVRRFFI